MGKCTDYEVAYSPLTDTYYFILGSQKYDITNFVQMQYERGKADSFGEGYRRGVDDLGNYIIGYWTDIDLPDIDREITKLKEKY